MTKALEIQEIDTDLYVHPPENLWIPPAGRGVFGGQIIAGAMMAAHKTANPEFSVHSLHAYFLLPGDNKRAIVYKVNRLRDGKSFATRSVTAVQNGAAIFGCEISFHRAETSSLRHQPEMPAAPPPDSLMSMKERLNALLKDPRLKPQHASLVHKSLEAPFPIDVRPVTPVDLFAPQRVWPARQLVWIRCTEPLGDDPYLHRSAVAYASDWSLASTMMLPHSVTFSSPRVRLVASLDHIMHFAAGVELRADDWMLYDMDSPMLSGGRGLNYGKIWRRDGQLAVCCTQEALIRVAEDKPTKLADLAAATARAPSATVDTGVKRGT